MVWDVGFNYCDWNFTIYLVGPFVALGKDPKFESEREYGPEVLCGPKQFSDTFPNLYSFFPPPLLLPSVSLHEMGHGDRGNRGRPREDLGSSRQAQWSYSLNFPRSLPRLHQTSQEIWQQQQQGFQQHPHSLTPHCSLPFHPRIPGWPWWFCHPGSQKS